MKKSISQVFINHPRLAWVVCIIISLCGAICLTRMPVAEYPNITPPMVTVTAWYVGASSDVMRENVGIILEDQINGVEDVWFYKSNVQAAGRYNCYITFRPGTNPNIALVNVQNAVKRAEPKLPAETLQSGITVKKRPEDQLARFTFMTDGSEVDLMGLANFVEKQIADALMRVEGVALVESSGDPYAMRVWLNPVRIAALGVTIDEIKEAILAQNVQAAAGSIGNEFANKYLTFKLNVKGKLKTKEEFENIIIRSNLDTGAQIRLRDIARVELGCNAYTRRWNFNDEFSASIDIYKTPEANSVETVKRVKAEIERLSQRLPKGCRYALVDDTTAFTVVFLKETFKTLGFALLLVILITYLFLQDWRATLVPAIAIPISILGTFAFLHPFGFTLNVLTMFGLILVIGSLVDDAIVVVENTQALMIREGLDSKAAASKSMTQITGAVLATTLVTLACYLPLAFYPGMVGMMYVQFAVTMCISLCLSTVVALVLSPVLCAYLLKKPREKPRLVFLPFNATVDGCRKGYLFFVRLLVRRAFLTVPLFAAVIYGLWYFSHNVRGAFLPNEDRGYIVMNCRLPEGQTLEQTIKVMDQFYDAAKQIPGIYSIHHGCGYSSLWGIAENMGYALVRLEHWDKRTTPEKQINAVMDKLKAESDKIYAAEFVYSQPAAIRGLGGSSAVGFNFCAIAGQSEYELYLDATDFVNTLATNEMVKSAYHGFQSIAPQLDLDIDRPKAQSLGITPKKIFQTLQNKLGAFYVNDFSILGGVYEVKLQNDHDYRAGVDDVLNIQIPLNDGSVIPLSSLGKLRYIGKARETMSYNKMLAAWCEVNPKPGFTSAQIMEMIERTPHAKNYAIEWGPVQAQERENEGRLQWLIALSLVFAYLFLVAQYESWTIPVSVMLSVLVALTGAFLGLWLTDTPLSIYAQLGCVMLIALSAKNAILMVEFSKKERESGREVADAALRGADLRYRAVMMTAWSFIFGVLPLVFASGAGAGAMRAIGVCTLGGMLTATLVGIIFVPPIYAIFQRAREFFTKR